MKNFKNFAFDVDLTLIRRNGTVIDGAPEIITAIMKKSGTRLAIASGASLFEVNHAIDLINAELPKDIKFDPTVIAFGGGYIKTPDKTIKNPIFNNELKELISIIREIDSKCVICYRTPEVNFYIDQNISDYLMAKLEHLPKNFGILDNLKDDDYLQSQMKNDNIYSLEIISETHHKEIFDHLTKVYTPKGYVVNFGTCVEINKLGKLNALKSLFGDVKKVVYFGDGYNDIPCFKECGLSFGLGDKEDVVKYATYQSKDHYKALDVLFNQKEETLTL